MFSNSNFNRQSYQSTNTNQHGGNIPQQYGGNKSSYAGTQQRFNDQKTDKFFSNNQPANVPHIPGSNIGNQSSNMAAQMQSFQKAYSSNLVQNSNISGTSSTNPQRKNNSSNLMTLPKPKTQDNKLLKQNTSEIKEETNEQSDTKGSRFKKRYGESLIEQIFIFTGTAERVLKWGKIFESRFCLFEVISSVIQIAEGKVAFEKILLLKDKKGPVLQVTYFSNSTHVNIENFHFGLVLRCVGRMIGPNIFCASAVRAATPEEIETLPRLCCACDRAVQYYCGVQNV